MHASVGGMSWESHVGASIAAFICGVGKAKKGEAVLEGRPADAGSCGTERFYIRSQQLSAARCQ